MSMATIVGISAKTLIAGAVGSAIGMVLGTGTWWERLLRGVVGAATAWVGHGVAAKLLVGLAGIVIAAEHLPTPAEMEPVAAFMIGIVGMVACQFAVNLVTAARDRADDFVEHHLEGDD